MNSFQNPTKHFLKIFHLPTFMLAIGFPLYWVEMYYLRPLKGQTSLLATILFSGVILAVLVREWQAICAWGRSLVVHCSNLALKDKWLLSVGCLIGLVTFSIALYAALFPPHLIQEFDVLNYHLTLPRQHLILGSFKHISWSTADLYLLPVDFALAPYWFATALPNKIPQFLFFIGLILISMNLVKTFNLRYQVSALFVMLAILGSHNMGIQMGTAMLDVVMCYLLIAALDSFLNGRTLLCALELTFYFWSKSFIPIQAGLIVVIMLVLFFMLKGFGVHAIGWTAGNLIEANERGKYKRNLRKVFICFIVLSIFIAGPFLKKSLDNSGTPLYPFLIGSFMNDDRIDQESRKWQSLVANTEKVMATKDQYGSGRSPLDFLKHLWLIAVPETGVNNRYDYPVGLMYLLCLGPFLFTFVRSIRSKQFLILPFFVMVFWATWWLGSHQSRFLFIPILIMIIIVFSETKALSRPFIICVLISMSLVSVSVFRAHKNDFGRSRYEVLREKDKRILSMSQKVLKNQATKLDFFDAAYANFPIDVSGVDSVFVLDK